MIFSQVFEMVNIGIVIIDKDMKIFKWNRWMEIQSKISSDEIVGSSMFTFFPNLKAPWFLRNSKSVFAFGNFSFFSQKLHKYLFPLKAVNTLGTNYEYMQQSCTMGPIRNENNQIEYAFITVQDVTEVTAYEQKLLEMNIKDGLTGIYNRRYLESRLQEEVERSKRYQRPMSLIMMDIDLFKRVNDNYGHQCGDYILKTFSSLIASILRTADVFARYGGEEFCCILPETDLSAAILAAEKIRKKIEDEIFNFNGMDLKITVSQGVSELSQKFISTESLLKKADVALYEAKRSGRNKVIAIE